MEQVLAGVLGLVFVVVFSVLAFWIPSEILAKAGFPRWYAIPIVLTGYLGLVVFALAEWPVHRELAWLRLKCGETSEDPNGSVERYAIDLERAGDWKQAMGVYNELTQRAATPEGAEYFRNCVSRLQTRMTDSAVREV